MKLIIFLLPFFLIFSCTPKELKNKQENNALNRVSSEAESQAPAPALTRTGDVSPESRAGDEGSKTENTPEVVEYDEFSGPLFLQSIKPHSYILPDSLIAGPQADPLSALLSEREADYLVRKFLTGYKEGKVRTELFTDDVHPLFLEELKEYSSEAKTIRTFYLGRFQQSGKSSMVRVVLLSETGYIQGVVYMEDENGIWGIQDWEMPFDSWPGDPVPLEGDDLILPGRL